MLGDKLRSSIDKLRSLTSFDDAEVKLVIRDIQRALIESDVEISLVASLSQAIQKKCSEDPPKGLSKREFVVKSAYDALVHLLGGKDIVVPDSPKRILLVGLFGSGKTTSVSKLSKFYSKRGLSVGVIAGDTFRPAAYEQLFQSKELGNFKLFGIPNEKDPAKVISQGVKELKDCDLLICDSAGRSALDSDLVSEIKSIKDSFSPVHIWLVIGADVGQLAKKQALAFHEAVGVDGVIVTRVDGSAKGGAALAAANATDSKVLFIGTGEKVDDFQLFDADRYLSRLLGYGDLESLLEKAREAFDDSSDLSPDALLSGDLNFKIFYEQLKATKKMGKLSKVLDLVGLKQQLPSDVVELGQEKLDSFGHIIDSMTEQERLFPDVLNRSRIERIASGSGKSISDVRELVKQHKQMKKMFKKFSKISPKNLEKMQSSGDMGKLLQQFSSPKKKKKFRFR